MLNYKIQYVKEETADGELVWEDLHHWIRPLYFTDKLNELLDSGVIDLKNTELSEITPTSQIRIVVTDDTDGSNETLDFIAADIQANMTRAS